MNNYRIYEDGPSDPTPRRQPVKGWRRLFRGIVNEPEVLVGESMPHYDALHPKQQEALQRIEKQIDTRFSALEKGKPITKDKTVNWKYKGDSPIMHEMGFLLPDYRYEFASIRSETGHYNGVHVSSGQQKMAAALIELYLAKDYHVLATYIVLNDPETAQFRDRHDSESGKFWELDICKDKVPTPLINPFSDVEMQSFGR
jgi:hypothetical protein